MFNDTPERRSPNGTATDLKLGPLLVILIGAVLLFFVIPSVTMSKDDAKRVAMRLRLRWITFGLREYYVLNHSYPPNRMAVEATTGGETIQSWRALLLPMMTGSEIAAKYDIHRPWDDAQNLAAASTIDHYSNCAGGSSTSIFLTNDACLIKAGKYEETPVDAILLVSMPNRSELWSTPSELSAEELWRAVREHPKLVMIGLSGGETVNLCDIASSEEECRDVLNFGRLTEEQRSVYQARITRSRDSRVAKEKRSIH